MLLCSQAIRVLVVALDESMVLNHLLVPVIRFLWFTWTIRICEVDADNSKTLSIATGPFEVVHGRPNGVTEHVTTIFFDSCTKNKGNKTFILIR